VLSPTETCALRSTQPLKVSTRDFSWGKGSRYVWLTTYYPCSAETSTISEALIYPEPLGPPRPVAGDHFFCLCSELLVCTHTSAQTDILEPHNKNVIEARADIFQRKLTLCVGERSSVVLY